jgi:hypothetical protein
VAPRRTRTAPSHRWVVAITSTAAILLIGIGALAARTLQAPGHPATETSSAVPQSTVYSPFAPSEPTASSSQAETEPTTPSSSAAADIRPPAAPASSRCAAPTVSSTAAVIGCSCNWGSGDTVTSDGTPAYCRHVLGVDIPVGFWMTRDEDIFAPTRPGDFNMYVCESHSLMGSCANDRHRAETVPSLWPAATLPPLWAALPHRLA